ncbi:HIT domain-containing protein [Patescibacteria group bacterium]|nr:HIT domain-containing protein [Patescibacteria group bacterium]
MVDSECVFCRIASHETEAKIEYEDDEWLVFHDNAPSAPVHLLIVPKKHFCWWEGLASERGKLGKMFEIAVKVAEEMQIKDSGFKLVMNGGEGAGQVVNHFHVHLLGGWREKIKS